MCIIVIKDKDAKKPSKTILKNCFTNNPDGAGFMYNGSDKKVHIRKGYMTFNAFYKALQNAYKDNEEATFIYHFRISTQGGTKQELTHPYPLSNDMKKLKLLSCNCNVGIAHNGIISLTSNSYVKTITYNDTMQFITDYLSLIIKDNYFYNDKDTLLLIERLIGYSKLAFLDGSGHITKIGDGWIKEDGLIYSNSSYKAVKTATPTKYNYDKFMYDYNDGWEAYFNDNTQSYNFDTLFCPRTEDDDDTYCFLCDNYDKCFSKEDDAIY